MNRCQRLVILGLLHLCLFGCAAADAFKDNGRHWRHKRQPQITAVSADPCEPDGIPYYLPKPLLIVTKNVNYVDGENLGEGRAPAIPDSFANQAEYGSVNASVAATAPVPNPQAAGGGGGESGDEGAPQSGFAEQVANMTGMPMSGALPTGSYSARIVFVPDFTQKYFLRVTGGPGEIRAALNLVNGWMFTGPGPYYQKDSSRAQNMMAFGAALKLGGSGAADVINSIGGLQSAARSAEQSGLGIAPGDVVKFGYEFHHTMAANGEPLTIHDYAEVHVYEQDRATGAWVPVVNSVFADRVYGVNRLSSVSLERSGSDSPPETEDDIIAPANDESESEDDATNQTQGGEPENGAGTGMSRFPANGFEQSSVGPWRAANNEIVSQIQQTGGFSRNSHGVSQGTRIGNDTSRVIPASLFELPSCRENPLTVNIFHNRDTSVELRSNLPSIQQPRETGSPESRVRR